MLSIERERQRISDNIRVAFELRRTLKTITSPLSFEIPVWPAQPARVIEAQANICNLQDLPPQTPELLKDSRETLADSALGIEVDWDEVSKKLTVKGRLKDKQGVITLSFTPAYYFSEKPINDNSGFGTPGCFHPNFCQLLGSLMVIDDESFSLAKSRGLLICSRQISEPTLSLKTAFLPIDFWKKRRGVILPDNPVLLGVFYFLNSDGIVKLSRKIVGQPVLEEDCPLVLVTQAIVDGTN